MMRIRGASRWAGDALARLLSDSTSNMSTQRVAVIPGRIISRLRPLTTACQAGRLAAKAAELDLRAEMADAMIWAAFPAGLTAQESACRRDDVSVCRISGYPRPHALPRRPGSHASRRRYQALAAEDLFIVGSRWRRAAGS
jgi:hypothetical protein